ncbi:MAG TPA: c-type cytochrome biogenesis protein CcmI [Stellaceae bacterium]|jgi:cytochrome c-type biogenesis protein CcmH|nr:c-type cytochrome biogenesis protein CcmI [Stellaceae bacterium]
MLALILGLVGMTLIVLTLVLGPLLKPARAPATREAFDRAVYRDQLKEIEREVARGAIAESEAATARLELQRRLLAADSDDKAVPPSGQDRGGARKPLLAGAIALAVVVIAGGIYLKIGSPGVPDEPYADRQAERDQMAQQQAQLTQIRSMVQKLADDMKEHPDNLEGWLRLGRSYAVLNQPDDAAAAFAEAEKLKPNDPAVLMAEAQALMAGRPVSEEVTPQVVTLLDRIQTLDPDEPAVLWYLGLHAAQQGDFKTARDDWQKVKDKLPPGSDEARTVATALEAIKDK